MKTSLPSRPPSFTCPHSPPHLDVFCSGLIVSDGVTLWLRRFAPRSVNKSLDFSHLAQLLAQVPGSTLLAKEAAAALGWNEEKMLRMLTTAAGAPTGGVCVIRAMSARVSVSASSAALAADDDENDVDDAAAAPDQMGAGGAVGASTAAEPHKAKTFLYFSLQDDSFRPPLAAPPPATSSFCTSCASSLNDQDFSSFTLPPPASGDNSDVNQTVFGSSWPTFCSRCPRVPILSSSSADDASRREASYLSRAAARNWTPGAGACALPLHLFEAALGAVERLVSDEGTEAVLIDDNGDEKAAAEASVIEPEAKPSSDAGGTATQRDPRDPLRVLITFDGQDRKLKVLAPSRVPRRAEPGPNAKQDKMGRKATYQFRSILASNVLTSEESASFSALRSRATLADVTETSSDGFPSVRLRPFGGSSEVTPLHPTPDPPASGATAGDVDVLWALAEPPGDFEPLSTFSFSTLRARVRGLRDEDKSRDEAAKDGRITASASMSHQRSSRGRRISQTRRLADTAVSDFAEAVTPDAHAVESENDDDEAVVEAAPVRRKIARLPTVRSDIDNSELIATDALLAKYCADPLWALGRPEVPPPPPAQESLSFHDRWSAVDLSYSSRRRYKWTLPDLMALQRAWISDRLESMWSAQVRFISDRIAALRGIGPPSMRGSVIRRTSPIIVRSDWGKIARALSIDHATVQRRMIRTMRLSAPFAASTLRRLREARAALGIVKPDEETGLQMHSATVAAIDSGVEMTDGFAKDGSDDSSDDGEDGIAEGEAAGVKGHEDVMADLPAHSKFSKAKRRRVAADRFEAAERAASNVSDPLACTARAGWSGPPQADSSARRIGFWTSASARSGAFHLSKIAAVLAHTHVFVGGHAETVGSAAALDEIDDENDAGSQNTGVRGAIESLRHSGGPLLNSDILRALMVRVRATRLDLGRSGDTAGVILASAVLMRSVSSFDVAWAPREIAADAALARVRAAASASRDAPPSMFGFDEAGEAVPADEGPEAVVGATAGRATVSLGNALAALAAERAAALAAEEGAGSASGSAALVVDDAPSTKSIKRDFVRRDAMVPEPAFVLSLSIPPTLSALPLGAAPVATLWAPFCLGGAAIIKMAQAAAPHLHDAIMDQQADVSEDQAAAVDSAGLCAAAESALRRSKSVLLEQHFHLVPFLRHVFSRAAAGASEEGRRICRFSSFDKGDNWLPAAADIRIGHFWGGRGHATNNESVAAAARILVGIILATPGVTEATLSRRLPSAVPLSDARMLLRWLSFLGIINREFSLADALPPAPTLWSTPLSSAPQASSQELRSVVDILERGIVAEGAYSASASSALGVADVVGLWEKAAFLAAPPESPPTFIDLLHMMPSSPCPLGGLITSYYASGDTPVLFAILCSHLGILEDGGQAEAGEVLDLASSTSPAALQPPTPPKSDAVVVEGVGEEMQAEDSLEL